MSIILQIFEYPFDLGSILVQQHLF